MFTAFVDEIVRAEGESAVLLIDTGSPYLTVYSDKWGCYKGNLLPTTKRSVEQLKAALEAVGLLVLVSNMLVQDTVYGLRELA